MHIPQLALVYPLHLLLCNYLW